MSTIPPSTGARRGDQNGKRIAVMQPYFFPYAGYFRLFAAVDEFVIFDCVQFPRRGRVHRTEITNASGQPAWLTLPIAPHRRDTRIMDLRFAMGAREEFDRRLRTMPIRASPLSPVAEQILSFLHGPKSDVVDYLDDGMRLVCGLLGLPYNVVRSSSLGLDPSLHGQERVLAIATARGATKYINPPGGRELYNEDLFKQRGIELLFLSPYQGRFRRLLDSLMIGEHSAIAADVRASVELTVP